jgi:hypothetical protein
MMFLDRLDPKTSDRSTFIIGATRGNVDSRFPLQKHLGSSRERFVGGRGSAMIRAAFSAHWIASARRGCRLAE